MKPMHRPALFLAAFLIVPLLAANPPSASAAATQPAASLPLPPTPLTAPAAANAWPRTLTENGATITIYQPQAVSWPDRRTLTARVAIAILRPGQKTPLIGTVEIALATTTDLSAGVVHLADPRLISSHFPALDTVQEAALEARLRAALPSALATRAVPLTAVLLSLNRSPVPSVAVDNRPPKIFTSSRPASLVVFDGPPVLAPAGESGLAYAVNTNWDVFETAGTWYLLANGLWLSAHALTGPYTPVAQLPPAFAHLPAGANFANARQFIPPHPAPAPDRVPTIFVATTPAEIIVTAGPPHFVPIQGTGLQRIDNTASALFFDPALGKFYVLFSGRWFSAPALEGPWSFATDKLPADFAQIPPASPEGAVLAAVPGTVQAEEAVLKAQIPTTATLKRGSVQPTVIYSGPPRFAPIPGTTMFYAVNTAAIVLKVGEVYYVCQNGAWFTGRAPAGPWTLAESIPPVIETIPPTFPYYNVTYVQVYSATPTTVTYGYTAGYVMGFVSAGVLVYGTGYYYPPVVIPGAVPIYYPYPYSYAGGVYYNPATGAWVRGGAVYGPYATATGGRYTNSSTGAWAAGGAIYGPYGGAGAWSAYNPTSGSYAHASAAWSNGSGSASANWYNGRSGVTGSTSQNWNPYGRWGSSTLSGPNQTVQTESRSNAQGAAGAFSSSSGAQGAGYHNTATGVRGGAAQGANGDVYAGRDGNVYRNTGSGWQKWGGGGWNPVTPPSGGSRLQAQGSYAQGSQAQGSHGNGAQGRGGSSAPAAATTEQLQRDRLGRAAGAGAFGGRLRR
ncbi:MAG: hypothetical protein ACREE5_10360 [Acetobacteraceae bacterium]